MFLVAIPPPSSGRDALTAKVSFTRRELLSYEECDASRHYYDVCLGSAQVTDPIMLGYPWIYFRPSSIIDFDEGERIATAPRPFVVAAGFRLGLGT